MHRGGAQLIIHLTYRKLVIKRLVRYAVQKEALAFPFTPQESGSRSLFTYLNHFSSSGKLLRNIPSL